MTSATLPTSVPPYTSGQKPNRYCRYCGSPISWKHFVQEKIINATSIFHWQIIRTENWVPFDVDVPNLKHTCINRDTANPTPIEEALLK